MSTESQNPFVKNVMASVKQQVLSNIDGMPPETAKNLLRYLVQINCPAGIFVELQARKYTETEFLKTLDQI